MTVPRWRAYSDNLVHLRPDDRLLGITQVHVAAE